MRAVVQRVKSARVKVNGKSVGAINKGLLVLLGVAPEDTSKEVEYLAKKIVGLRIFEDDNGKMNLSLDEVGGEMLVVSQFTLYGDCRKGRRPSFVGAAPPELAEKLYEEFVNVVDLLGIKTETGKFGAMMDVSLVNQGPVTLIVESK
ncbi:D-tyrosyl-tRNA(Tyr) deacylase [Desulfatibacillum aliphaticivorans]|uniref:D-aminoacyl-tRNA deacylase n=1 Tax=Desulfatibacillum aliphaticivorans TaxID=218208 RepID=DTD_DESAL|nr:D-aminoacyl-tRNA deacylase [Desulfatibacillum aliphaticivorans]B8FHU4.1 RecName: Full=D-aminoacyl-tRNA deacylase; Short=DTD; AltName: Full=Gly-tRNA(Ala) deacylase [Desulfatibacillum aliphaticivorans]ACL02511.1 D-tyrosyl-tRNA(Tyr) deacylase [Desulfatibacillum aliphaticivorans]